MVELGCRYIDQEQDQNPNLDREKTMRGERGDHVRGEVSYGIVRDEPKLDKFLEKRTKNTTTE